MLSPCMGRNLFLTDSRGFAIMRARLEIFNYVNTESVRFCDLVLPSLFFWKEVRDI